MKLSSSWIREFVDLTVDDHRLAEDLTGVGIAVEGISGSGKIRSSRWRLDQSSGRDESLWGGAEAAAIYDVPLKGCRA